MTRSDVANPQQERNKKMTLVNVGRYQMLKVLGKGNFARVEEALHTVLNVKVAVKVIDTGAIREDYVMKNLTREAKLLSMLSHPHIVRLYETIKCGSLYYLVIELATGGDLYSHIKNQPLGRLDEKTAKNYGCQLVAALNHMHSRGIVHRDLKMENIMLQDPRKEHIKIVDFGLSNLYAVDDPLKTHCGSPEYAAPELFVVGKKYGPEVDLWSLGVVFYAMATGRLPFLTPRDGQASSEERRRKLLAQINRGLAPQQKKSIAAMSSEYRNLVSRLLVPAAHKRITIRELCFHPWITNRQKEWRKISPKSEISALEHAAIIKEIAALTNREKMSVERDVLRDRYGDIGGMYNIKSHVTRQGASFHHAFHPRSWSTASHSTRHSYNQQYHVATPTRTAYETRQCPPANRCLPGRAPTSAIGQRPTTTRRTSVVGKSSSSGGIWTPHDSFQRSDCIVHRNRTALPGVHSSSRQSNWDAGSMNVSSQGIVRHGLKSISGFAERPLNQPFVRQPPRQAPATASNDSTEVRREEAEPRDSVERWIAEKLKNLERDRDRLRAQFHTSSSVLKASFESTKSRNRDAPTSFLSEHRGVQFLCRRRIINSDVISPRYSRLPVQLHATRDDRRLGASNRHSLSATPVVCGNPWKIHGFDQFGSLGQGDRCFYRSSAIRQNVRKPRLVQPNGMRFPERHCRITTRPVTAKEDATRKDFGRTANAYFQHFSLNPYAANKSINGSRNSIFKSLSSFFKGRGD